MQRAGLLVAGGLSTGGCSTGAPSLILAGSYFPAWLACAILGVFGAILCRVLLLVSGLGSMLPYQLALCLGAGTIVGLLAARLWFGL